MHGNFFPFGWGVAGSTVCCFGLGSVFKKIPNSMKSFGLHIYIMVTCFQ